jgi:hypothetical protein
MHTYKNSTYANQNIFSPSRKIKAPLQNQTTSRREPELVRRASQPLKNEFVPPHHHQKPVQGAGMKQIMKHRRPQTASSSSGSKWLPNSTVPKHTRRKPGSQEARTNFGGFEHLPKWPQLGIKKEDKEDEVEEEERRRSGSGPPPDTKRNQSGLRQGKRY